MSHEEIERKLDEIELKNLRKLKRNKKLVTTKKIGNFRLSSPTYFEDNEICGYCSRQPGQKHETWCRQ